MLNVLMIGAEGSHIETLYFALVHRELTVHLVHDRETLRAMLDAEAPDLVIFDHIEPADLFVLNPRALGFSGPVLLLTDEHSPTAQELLRTEIALHKPVMLTALWQMIDEIASLTRE
jgi:DNA-binding response OmpR family regulator